jgi:hypothetical protein
MQSWCFLVFLQTTGAEHSQHLQILNSSSGQSNLHLRFLTSTLASGSGSGWEIDSVSISGRKALHLQHTHDFGFFSGSFGFSSGSFASLT